MKPFYEILKMIEAHYNNDDDKFNNYARAIIDFYKKDGDIEGVDEILEIMTKGHLTPRTEMPKLLQETTKVYPEKEITNLIDNVKNNDNHTQVNNTEEIKVPKKRHRRTKAKMEEYRKTVDIISVGTEEKKKRHRRTKAEMQAARLAKGTLSDK